MWQLRYFWSYILDLIFPKICCGCGAWGKYLCWNVERTCGFEFSVCPAWIIPLWLARHMMSANSEWFRWFHYNCTVRRTVSLLIKKVKYRYMSDAVDEIVEIFLDHWPLYAPKFDMLIPIPMHPKNRTYADLIKREKLVKG